MSLLRALQLPPLPRQAPQPAPVTNLANAKTQAPAARSGRLSQAAQTWRKTHRAANGRIAALKKSVQTHYADRHPETLKQIDGVLARLDEILDNVDHRLADALAKAGAATTDSDRKTELTNAKAVLTEYINYVKSEPLIAHVDDNPFGVKTDLRALLAMGLTNAAKAIS